MSTTRRAAGHPLGPTMAWALALLSACGAPALPPTERVTARTAPVAEEPPIEAVPSAPEPSPVAAPDERLVGDWIAEGDVFTALFASLSIQDGQLVVELLRGLPAHASGEMLCGGSALPGEPFECEDDAGAAARLRVERVESGLAAHLEGDGWSELGLTPSVVLMRRIGPLESMLWVSYSDVAHEAGELGEPAPEGPEETIATLHAALSTAGIDPLALDDTDALTIWEESETLAERAAQCAEARCACGPDASERLATLLSGFRSSLRWLASIGTWSGPTTWNTYVRIDTRGHATLYAFPDRVVCESALTATVLTLSCGGRDVTLDGSGPGFTVASGGDEPARFRSATVVELLGMRDIQALEAPARDAAWSRLRVANTLRPAPRTDAGARAALDAAEAALVRERRCRDARTPECERAALQTLERRRARDRAFRCSLFEGE